jgi:HAD superfamily hydrolase (TIGR01662 family)
MTQRTRPFPEVEALLADLQARGLRWGVVTNKAERFTRPLSERMALFTGASALVSGDTTPHAKPHPAPLLEAARRLELKPSECLYVGDDERDILAGRAAGMRTVAASYGYLGHGAVVSAWGADAEVTSPLDLLKWLDLP